MFHHNPGLTFNFWNFKIFPVLKVNSLCKIIFLIFFGKFPVFSLSGKSKNQIPCFPCAVATLSVVARRAGNPPSDRLGAAVKLKTVVGLLTEGTSPPTGYITDPSDRIDYYISLF